MSQSSNLPIDYATLSSLGGKARMAKMTAAERSAHARHAAQVRWQKKRAEALTDTSKAGIIQGT